MSVCLICTCVQVCIFIIVQYFTQIHTQLHAYTYQKFSFVINLVAGVWHPLSVNHFSQNIYHLQYKNDQG